MSEPDADDKFCRNCGLYLEDCVCEFRDGEVKGDHE